MKTVETVKTLETLETVEQCSQFFTRAHFCKKAGAILATIRAIFHKHPSRLHTRDASASKKGKGIGMQTDESEWCLSVDGLTVAKHPA